MNTYSRFQSNWVVIPQVRSLRETAYGVRTHYVTAGEGEPLVLVHGAGPGASGATGWANTIPVLAKHFRVYAIDQIGYGDTDKPLIDYSMQTYVEHLAGFIDALKLQNVRVMGNSQGAYVAIKYVLDNPGYVKSAALLATGGVASACGIPNGERAGRLPHFDGSKDSVRKFIEMIVNDKSKITDELIDTRFASASLPGHKEMHESIGRFRRLVNSDPNIKQVWYIRERLMALKIPYCFIWGEEDRTALLDPQGIGLKALLPDVPFHIISGAGHQVQNDKPDECNKLILDHFLKN